MTGYAPRATVDFDAFERELRQPAGGSDPTKADPMAELARIVGQDDPFRALLEAQGQRPAEGRPGRVEPIFVDAGPQPQDGQPAMTQTPAAPDAAQNPAQSPADAFDQYLASVEQGLYTPGRPDDPADDPAAFAEADESYRAGPVERPRGRSRLVQVGAGLAVLAVCVGGALAWRGTQGSGGNGPITVLADKTPLKVQPAATDGVEIPDQNKQIYDRNAKDGQIRIVNREEQPLDVAQAARSAAAKGDMKGDMKGDAALANPGQGGATPGQPGLLTDSLGEPRRVRTVAVKPESPPLQPPPAQAPAAPSHADVPPVSPIPTMTMPDSAPPPATPRRSARTLAAAPAPAAEASEPAAPPPPAARPRTPQRVASIAPETTASTEAETPEPGPAAQAPVGGFSVQLGVRGSESEARAAFRQMQAKYSQLSGKPELIRQAEVNGKTLYRVRVGPLAKSEASSLCSELQGAGGQCFVAKN